MEPMPGWGGGGGGERVDGIGHFRVAVNLIMKARLSAKTFHTEISFVCI